MTGALGWVRSYDDLQPILRARADALNISRETIDDLAGLPKGYAGKVLAAVPMRRLGPDTLGPMLGALGVKLAVVEDADAMARFTARAGKRVIAATMHSGAVVLKISLRKLRKMARKGGKNSRSNMSGKQASKLGRKASLARWRNRSSNGSIAG